MSKKVCWLDKAAKLLNRNTSIIAVKKKLVKLHTYVKTLPVAVRWPEGTI